MRSRAERSQRATGAALHQTDARSAHQNIDSSTLASFFQQPLRRRLQAISTDQVQITQTGEQQRRSLLPTTDSHCGKNEILCQHLLHGMTSWQSASWEHARHVHQHPLYQRLQPRRALDEGLDGPIVGRLLLDGCHQSGQMSLLAGCALPSSALDDERVARTGGS
jgi:hypothetical protein